MNGTRRIFQSVQGRKAIDGAGVHLVRVIGHQNVRDFDPFLMLDAFDSENPDDYVRGFPWHPHRGIETVTYLVHGCIEHGDSLGNKGQINDGDCQWMTAGSGIIHQEMPQPSPKMFGLQLWINLPARDKMTKPAYRDLKDAAVPVISDGAARIRLVCGRHGEQVGPFEGEYVKALFMDIELPAGASWSRELPENDTAFLYVLQGGAMVGQIGQGQTGDTVNQRTAALLTPGSRLELTAGAAGLRCILVSAPPLREPVAWGGPIVMNTQAELEQAFRELDDGTFIKKA